MVVWVFLCAFAKTKPIQLPDVHYIQNRSFSLYLPHNLPQTKKMTTLELNSFKQTIKEEFPEDFPEDWEYISSWSSMQMLLIMTAINDRYDVLISHEDFKQAKSVEELFEITCQKNN